MDEVIAFLRKFIADEYAAEVAACTEGNYDVLMDKVRSADAYFRLTSGVSSNIGRPRYLPESLLARLRAKAERTVQRRVFEIVRFEHPDMGPLYRCVLSGTAKGTEGNFGELLVVGNLGDGLQILARSVVCATCNGTGAHRGEKCPDCLTTGWSHRGGMRLVELGKRGEVQKLEPPADPAQREMYEAS